MIECALVMAYIGDARVITTDLTGPFCPKCSLLELSLPSISKALNFDKSIALEFAHHPANWPLNKFGQPDVPSKWSQVLTFGDDHFMI